MQPKAELEQWYSTIDPWGYKKNPDDQRRKDILLGSLEQWYKRALDIGAGEGWITTDLPADEIHAIEISDNAANRFPDNVVRVDEPQGTYDLVVVTGMLYDQYDYAHIANMAKTASSKHILLCNISTWEKGLDVFADLDIVLELHFPYRDYTEHLCLYQK